MAPFRVEHRRAVNDCRKAGPAGLVGPGRLELPTSRLSGVRSNQAELRAYGGTTANGDGGAPQFIGVPIDNLVRDGLEEHP
jgi:hypothetical protein